MKTLGILVFPDFETLDVFGPIEVFGCLPNQIQIVLIAENPGTVTSVHGQSLLVDYSCAHAPLLDMLLIPGGQGTRREVANQPLISWIHERGSQVNLLLSVCTGAALLAKAGLLDHHQATTNKRAFSWVVEQGPQVRWIKEARWVHDRNRITAAGIAAGIDMSFYILKLLFGETLAAEVAQTMEYTALSDPSLDSFAYLYP